MDSAAFLIATFRLLAVIILMTVRMMREEVLENQFKCRTSSCLMEPHGQSPWYLQ